MEVVVDLVQEGVDLKEVSWVTGASIFCSIIIFHFHI
jgi:hypothetical protein